MTRKQETVAQEFEACMRARGEQRHILREVLHTCCPCDIALTALSHYRRFGNSDRLELGVQLLHTMGERGMNIALALHQVALDCGNGQEAFVGLAHADYLTDGQRSILLNLFAESSSTTIETNWIKYSEQKPEHGQECWVYSPGDPSACIYTYREWPKDGEYEAFVEWAAYIDRGVTDADLWQPCYRPAVPVAQLAETKD